MAAPRRVVALPIGSDDLARLESIARSHSEPAVRIRVQACIERSGEICKETRHHIASATLSAERASQAVRSRWGTENRLPWVLDRMFDDDQCRPRKGFGAKNRAVIRHFALEPGASRQDARSIKLHRNMAGRTPAYLNRSLNEPVN